MPYGCIPLGWEYTTHLDFALASFMPNLKNVAGDYPYIGAETPRGK